MLSPGTILQARYRIDRKLGEGGMGAVYEATDERFGTPIALKEIIFDAANESQKENLGAAFGREAKSLATARHEAIPFVRDYFSEGERQFLVMELVEGDDLAELLQQNKRPFPLDSVLDWMRQLLDALDYLHNLKPPIIHRDIKPQNLKITSRNRLKLLDFGIAKSSEASAAATKTFVGATLNYSPIEQILRVIDPTFREFIILKHEAKARAVLAQSTDERADIFAAGGTFYHLLTDHLPEEATKRTIDVWEGGPDPLPHPSDLNPAIPRSLGDCLLRSMAIERDDRFGSAAEMLDSLNTGLNSRQSVIKSVEAVTVPFYKTASTPTSGQTDPMLPKPDVGRQEPVGQRTEQLISHESLRSSPETDWSAQIGSHLHSGTVPNTPADLEVQNQVTVQARSLSIPSSAGVNTIYWIIPVAGIILFAVVGGGFIMLNGFGGASNTHVLNGPFATPRAIPSPTVTQQSTSVSQVYASPTPTPTPTPTVPTPGHSSRLTDGDSRQNVTKTKAPPAKKSVKGGQDLNCIYTNSCK